MRTTKVEAMPLKLGPMLFRIHTDEGIVGISNEST